MATEDRCGRLSSTALTCFSCGVGVAGDVEGQVAIVEIMKLMVPVHADVTGTIVEVLKENGEHVEYDEPLFAVSPAA